MRAFWATLAAAGALLVTTGVSIAQPASDDVAFSVVLNSTDCPKEALEKEIASLAELEAFLGGSIPEGVDVDPSKEAVFGVSLGERRTGGYSVAISSVTITLEGALAPLLTIAYRETEPGKGMVTDALTCPAQVIKLTESVVYQNVVFREVEDRGATGVAVCGGFAGIECPEGQVCELPAGECDAADLQGACVKRPDFCTQDYRPVCGCDDKTYGNDCRRIQAGVQKARDGKCQQE